MQIGKEKNFFYFFREKEMKKFLVRHVIRNRTENRKSRFSLKPVGMAKLKVTVVNRDANRGWKKENFFSQLDLLLSVAKIEV